MILISHVYVIFRSSYLSCMHQATQHRRQAIDAAGGTNDHPNPRMHLRYCVPFNVANKKLQYEIQSLQSYDFRGKAWGWGKVSR